MYILYYKPTCPYCIKVLNFAKDAGIEFALKDINDEEIRAELVERGGKAMVPYLVDEKSGTEMYESDDIIAYLSTQA